MKNYSSEFWAITSYFNPMAYRNRRENYDKFRRNLRIPLVTVELCYHAAELSTSDADIYIRLTEGAILWQKERLLNVALAHLPAHVRYVAWLDCDVVFDRQDWDEAARRALHKFSLVQLFSHMVDLGPGSVGIPETTINAATSGAGIAYLLSTEGALALDFRPNTSQGMRRALFGLAWAARRDLLERHKFYDAMIIGSGDRAMLCAAMCRHGDVISTARMNPARVHHYLEWAEPFRAEVQGNVGYVDGTLWHCWHGNIADRCYLERHIAFFAQRFDPVRDITINSQGLWEWTSEGKRHESFMREYFRARQEDMPSANLDDKAWRP